MKTRSLISLFFLLDVILLSGLMLLVSYLHYGRNDPLNSPVRCLLLLFNVSWLISTLIFIDDMRNLKLGLSTALKTQIQKFIVFISIVSVSIISVKVDDISRSIFFGTVGLFVITKFALSLWIYYFYSLRDELKDRPTVIVGNTKIGRELYRYFGKYPFIGLKPIGILDNQSNCTMTNNVIGNIADFETVFEMTPFSDVVITLPLSEMDYIKDIISVCERNGVKTHIVPNYYGTIDRMFSVNMFGSIPMLDLRSVPLDMYPNRFWKRLLDLVGAVVLLFALSPIMVTVAILIKLESKGPVLYKPIRLGLNNRPFMLFKFRSMYHSDEVTVGLQSTVKNDPRVTPLGKFLRKSNLDELPQLINVILNEMSLVGPRPHRINLNITLKQKVNTYLIRHWVKPGITGWAQVNGWRGPTDGRLQYMARTLHDLWYVENWSFWLDIYIIICTLFSRKSKKNAF